MSAPWTLLVESWAPTVSARRLTLPFATLRDAGSSRDSTWFAMSMALRKKSPLAVSVPERCG
jgi:hypothetical protein